MNVLRYAMAVVEINCAISSQSSPLISFFTTI